MASLAGNAPHSQQSVQVKTSICKAETRAGEPSRCAFILAQGARHETTDGITDRCDERRSRDTTPVQKTKARKLARLDEEIHHRGKTLG
jgi:hypothetical protein